MPHPASSNSVTRTPAFKRYIKSIDRLIAHASASGQFQSRHLEAVLVEAPLIGKRDVDIIADLEAMTQRDFRRATIAATHRWQKIIALLFSLLRRHDKENPNAPSMMHAIHSQFQREGVYANLASVRDRAEQAHKELAELAKRHRDLPILNMSSKR